MVYLLERRAIIFFYMKPNDIMELLYLLNLKEREDSRFL